MNKLISANYWFGCDWVFYEVGYLGWRAGQLSLACAVVYLWNTGYLWVTRPRLYPGIQQKPLLFWKGDTDELNAKTKGSDRIPTKKNLV